MNHKVKILCFSCGECYHRLHQCAKKQLRSLVLEDNETVNKEGEIIVIQVKEEEDEDSLDYRCMVLFGFVEAN